jgi:hypothetical protein
MDPEQATVSNESADEGASQRSLRARPDKAVQAHAGGLRHLHWGMTSGAPLRRHKDALIRRDDAELAQRGRLVMDVSSAGLENAEAALGAFHPTTWQFRDALDAARRTWERLRAALGTKGLEAALDQPPLATLSLGEHAKGSPRVVLVLIEGKTYRAEKVAGTELAPIQWRVTRLHPPLENGPYYVCRLGSGATQCDCAEWTYRIAETSDTTGTYCKHLAALVSLGWL